MLNFCPKHLSEGRKQKNTDGFLSLKILSANHASPEIPAQQQCGKDRIGPPSKVLCCLLLQSPSHHDKLKCVFFVFIVVADSCVLANLRFQGLNLKWPDFYTKLLRTWDQGSYNLGCVRFFFYCVGTQFGKSSFESIKKQFVGSFFFSF